jgi:hypothetical protein
MVSRETQAFFSLGMQYYVAARFSAFARFSPVCGNLFHHAIEMFLKGQLASKKSLADLKDLGHRLGSLWGHFKQDVGDSALTRFDQTVTDLDAFESIRYPNQVLAYGMQSFISISHRHTTGATWQPQIVASGQQWSYQPPATQPRPEPIFQIVVKEIDELAWVVFEKSSVNPKFFTNSLPAEAKEYLSKENDWAFV